MKKNLFFVFTMLCALSFFTACSDDDDNKTDDGWKAISATYTAETLKLTMGGTEVADQSVKVDASSAEQATITLANPVNYEIAPDGKSARVYIDKALVSQIAPLLPTLAELIGDDALNGMGQLVKSILKAFPEAMEKTTKFEVGLKLIK